MTISILMIYTEDNHLRQIEQVLRAADNKFDVEREHEIRNVVSKLRNKEYNILIIDFSSVEKVGTSFIEDIRFIRKKTSLVMITSSNIEEETIVAMNLERMYYLRKNNNPEHTYHEIIDMTREIYEKTKSEEFSDEMRDKYTSLIEESLQGFAIIQNNQYVYANEAFAKAVGLTVNELLELKEDEMWARIHPEDIPALKERNRKLHIGAEIEPRHRFRYIHPDGSIRHVEGFMKETTFDNRPATQILELDITDLVESEIKLRKSETKHRSLVEESRQGVAIAKGNLFNLVYTNPRIKELLGYSDDYEMDWDLTDFLRITHIEDQSKIKEIAANATKVTKNNFEFNVRLRACDGRYIVFEVHAVKTEYESDTAFQLTFIDVTEKIHLEQEREKELSAFKLITEATVRDMGINEFCHYVIVGVMEGMNFDRGSIRLFNPNDNMLVPVAVYGYSTDEFKNIKPEDAGDDSILVSHIATTGIPLFAPNVRENQMFEKFKHRFDTFEAEAIISYPIFGKGGQLLGVLTISSKTPGRITDRNQIFFETMTELLASAIEKKRAEHALAQSEVQYRTFVESSLEGIVVLNNEELLYANSRAREILEITRGGDTHLTLDEAFGLIHPNDLEKAMSLFTEIKEGETNGKRAELRFITNKGNLKLIETYTRSLEYESKAALIVFLFDITDRYERELDRQRHQREIELYAGILQHDIGNELQLIQQYSEIIGASIEDDPEQGRKMIHSLDGVLNRTGHLLRVFVLREESSHHELVKMIEEIVNQTKQAHPKVSITFEVISGPERVQITAGRLLPMVFENLIRNSIQHGSESVSIDIQITYTSEHVEVVVQDDGPGIPEHIREHIFKKGTTTNSGGLGLYLAKQVVNTYNGEIEYRTTSTGACFAVRLPILI